MRGKPPASMTVAPPDLGGGASGDECDKMSRHAPRPRITLSTERTRFRISVRTSPTGGYPNSPSPVLETTDRAEKKGAFRNRVGFGEAAADRSRHERDAQRSTQRRPDLWPSARTLRNRLTPLGRLPRPSDDVQQGIRRVVGGVARGDASRAAPYRSMLLAIARRASANSAGVLAVSPEAWSAPPAKWTSDLTVRRNEGRWDGPGRELAKIATAVAVAYTASFAYLFRYSPASRSRLPIG